MNERFKLLNVTDKKACILDMEDLVSEFCTPQQVSKYTVDMGIPVSGVQGTTVSKDILSTLNFRAEFCGGGHLNYSIFLDDKKILNSECAYFKSDRNDCQADDIWIKKKGYSPNGSILLVVWLSGCVKYDYEFTMSTVQLVEVPISYVSNSRVCYYTKFPLTTCHNIDEMVEETQGDCPSNAVISNWGINLERYKFLHQDFSKGLPLHKCLDRDLQEYLEG